MADLSKIKLPSGTEYDIKDATARSMIESLNQFTYEVVSTLPTASSSTMYKIYLKAASTAGTSDDYEEFITIDKGSEADPRYVWEKLGTITPPDLSNYVSKTEAGDLAYKDSASGTVAVPKTYTTTFTGKAKDVTVTGTTTGSVSLTKSVVDVKPNATGTAANKYTPSGSNAASTVSGTCSVTPEGSIDVTTTNTTKYVASSESGGGSVTAGSAASCTMPTYTVASGSETLTITAGSFTANTPTAVTLPTFSSQSIATGIDTKTFSGSASSGTIDGTAAAQTFTGDDTYLKTVVEVGTAASFTGDSMTSTGSYTPEATSISTTTATTEDKTVTVS